MRKAFTEGKIRQLKIKNRIVLPPMVCFGYADKGGFVSDRNVEHYEAFAKGGTGLIILEAAAVSEKGRLGENQLGLWSDTFIPGLQRITEACHRHGSKVFLQLFHGGAKTPKTISEDIISSSTIKLGENSSREMSKTEINQIQLDFREAIARAEKAGFDGVELHGAHSYLLTQFFSNKANHRTDEYGGCLENRLRFATEIIKAAREQVKSDFVLGIRMGCNEEKLETSIQMAKHFETTGVDYLHISTGFDNEPILELIPEAFPYNWIVYGATKIKENVSIPVIGVNSIKTGAQLEALIDEGLVDFVAVGRAHLSDSKFTEHIYEQKGLVECLGCKPCKWFRDGNRCPNRKGY